MRALKSKADCSLFIIFWKRLVYVEPFLESMPDDECARVYHARKSSNDTLRDEEHHARGSIHGPPHLWVSGEGAEQIKGAAPIQAWWCVASPRGHHS